MSKNYRSKLMTLAGAALLGIGALLIAQQTGAAATQAATDECSFCTPYDKLVRWVDSNGYQRIGWITCYKPVGGAGNCPPCEDPDLNSIIVVPVR